MPPSACWAGPAAARLSRPDQRAYYACCCPVLTRSPACHSRVLRSIVAFEYFTSNTANSESGVSAGRCYPCTACSPPRRHGQLPASCSSPRSQPHPCGAGGFACCHLRGCTTWPSCQLQMSSPDPGTPAAVSIRQHFYCSGNGCGLETIKRQLAAPGCKHHALLRHRRRGLRVLHPRLCGHCRRDIFIASQALRQPPGHNLCLGLQDKHNTYHLRVRVPRRNLVLQCWELHRCRRGTQHDEYC